ncbi:MAG: DUF2309 domain-containing protein [Chloroflexota bacterium]
MRLEKSNLNSKLTHATIPATELSVPQIKSAVSRTVRLIAPLWSLQNFVAVNPFLGLTDRTFDTAVSLLSQRAGATMTAPRSFYAEAIRSGRITEADLAAALAEGNPVPGAPRTVAMLREFALGETAVSHQSLLPTVADVAESVTQTAWGHFVTEAISRWAASYFDQGQAYWKSPWRDLSTYDAWRAEAEIDRTPEIAGLRDFRQLVHSLPKSPQETIETVIRQLGVPAAGLEAYLHRLLLTIGGWAGRARHRQWEAELRDQGDTTIDDLLAIRLVYELALLHAFEHDGLAQAWADQLPELAGAAPLDSLQAGDLLLHTAFEKAYQRELMAQLAASEPAAKTERPAVQAAFCIDVRSEPFRRALEASGQGIETIGFAGFFGFPIEYVRLGADQGGAQCPALLAPQFVIQETVQGATPEEEAEIRTARALRQRAAKAWRMFKFGAVACFGFVGPVGLAYVKKLITDGLGWTRPVSLPHAYGLDKEVVARLGPQLEPQVVNGRSTGMTPEQRLDVAEGVLRAMSLTGNFARLVLLAGHGSNTVNNPYASGLDCGACGGHAGEANARVAAQVLNDPAVRVGLIERGIEIPDDTIFLAGQHDTTTDGVTIFDKATLPASHAAELAELEAQLAAAGRLTRAERAPLLGLDGVGEVDTAVLARSRDWSQVRPEWGLAGCAAFIVAPRQRTAGLNLNGRSFLHSYDWRQDDGFGVLELIMTAPMVVASWINLQYFGSTVDNRVFGSGNKALHNVVSALGVLEGNGGDLRTGLPWQSVHDGERFIHEPLRLNVMIEAPTSAMSQIIARHETVRHLLDNQWMYLFALDDAGRVAHRYVGRGRWEKVEAA